MSVQSVLTTLADKIRSYTDKSDKLKLEAMPNEIDAVYTKGYDKGKAEGGDIEIGFNCRYLINSIRAAEGEEIIISFKTPTQAITIEPKVEDEKFDYLYMVLPVRMNDK